MTVTVVRITGGGVRLGIERWRCMAAVMTLSAARLLLACVLAVLIWWPAHSYGLLAWTCLRLTR